LAGKFEKESAHLRGGPKQDPAMSRIIAPIILFAEDDPDKIVIDKTLLIRKIRPVELVQLFGTEVDFEDQKAICSKRINHTFFWADIPKELPMLPSPVVYPYYLIEAGDPKNIEDLILTLRLLYEKTVICPKAADSGFKRFFFFRPFNFTQKTFFSTVDIVTIPRKDIKKIRKNFNNVKNNGSKNTVVRARVNTCLDLTQKHEIRFVEAISIIESILCSSERDELRFRFSLLGYYLLTKLGFKVTRKSLLNFYDIRSSLVHSGRKGKHAKERLGDALQYSKTIYLEFCRNGFDGQDILCEIEKTIRKGT